MFFISYLCYLYYLSVHSILYSYSYSLLIPFSIPFLLYILLLLYHLFICSLISIYYKKQRMDIVKEQQKIEERIRQEEIDRQIKVLENEHPELLVKGDLVFVKVKINGVVKEAMIDCGAQETVISIKACKDYYRVKKMYQGVGRTQTIGVIHLVPIIIGNTYCITTLNVLGDDSPLDHLLIGTNTLKSIGAVIDFSESVLRIKDDKIKFMSNTDVDYILQKPFHIRQIHGDSSFKKTNPIFKPTLPNFENACLPRYPIPLIEQVMVGGKSEEEASEILDKSGGDITFNQIKLY
ncbi:DNA-damage inducible protein ddi1, putative [Entamoeba dispar SAW760]|uniref:DNA-damage inducible protein ddi1, putative n=1 Tax=Entamoeba dispar (strain ATCC PRA-260 / SAW760) TaxID=370354 RepID=B0EDI1_ENTDS|nr:DNA-damage inducible protein ddi1, putative [Entamoeba dispar SAW760]EDR27407.1 DNA-damage inducible protein ddi1, putative [Entamoeba dispar SAW760]|eukprot:EDR27407.1 DNA-damage inducible protein ddi1, putative [Entamoeba dispar SAW760]